MRNTAKHIRVIGVLLVMGLESACASNPPDNTADLLAASSTLAPDTPVSEAPVTPTSLDREFEDDVDMQERRDQLIENFVAPMVTSERVLAAMRAVPRHSFIPVDNLDAAYIDFPLPIGYGQTISQPSLVAMMTELLELEAGERVLEIGTGSGYQAAILRELTDQVYTVEIIPELAGIARAVLDQLGYKDIHVSRHDGYYGWQEYAPYDAIIVTAAPDHLPSPLLEQLKPETGRLVIPIGPVGDAQALWLVTREGDEAVMTRVMDVVFVPLTREN
jgi:protein-L-isoaspartate(D-aspartate) O-methyltransferase